MRAGVKVTGELPPQARGYMTITSNVLGTAVVGTADPFLAPLTTPVPVGTLDLAGYTRIDYFVDEESTGVDFADNSLVITQAGTYNSFAAHALFSHSVNSSRVSLVLAVERGGYLVFSQRPVVAEAPNNGVPVNLAGGGSFTAEVGDKLSMWVASSKTGTVTVISADIGFTRQLS